MHSKLQERYELIQKMRGHAADAVAATKQYERVPKYTTVSFGMRELCPRMKSDSDSESDFSTRTERGATGYRSPICYPNNVN